VSEAEVGDAPGRDPGGSGFEPRRTPRYDRVPGARVVPPSPGRRRHVVRAALAGAAPEQPTWRGTVGHT